MEASNSKQTYYDDSLGTESIFYLWEKGEARGDSVTPATYSADYRLAIVGLINNFIPSKKKILSIGCGNATIEKILLDLNFEVVAIDPHPIAVEIAGNKGIKVEQKNFDEIDSQNLENVTLIYMDGVIGHLLNDDKYLSKSITLLTKKMGKKMWYLLCSNDAPKSNLDIEPHPKVPDFWYISKSYLTSILAKNGFTILFAEYINYSRPISGNCSRTVVLCKFL